MRNSLRPLALLPIAALCTLALAAQPAKPSPRELSLQNLFDPKDRVSFSGAQQGGFFWLDDKSFTWPHTNEKGEIVEQLVYDAATGTTRPLFDARKLEAAVKTVPGMTPEAAPRVAKARSWNFSPDRRAVLLTLATDLYLFDLDKASLTRLTTAAGEEEEASFSPDGKSIAFVRRNNLYVVDADGQHERALTTDGSDDILNGSLDWVYQEEVFGRGNFHAYWWSPDSSRLAYLRLDERPVKRFAVVDHLPVLQHVDMQPYPKAGYPNPRVQLMTVNAAAPAPREISTADYSDFLIVSVDWAPDSRHVVYQVQNREQTWLDLNLAGDAGGAPKVLFRETTKAWVEPNGNPVWLKDGSFLWLSERTGFKHIDRYTADGKLLSPLTSGPWEVRTLHGVDEANAFVYFSGTERSVLGSDVYRIRLDGSGLQRLSAAPGAHNATFNPSLTMYVDSFSDVETPARITLHHNDGTAVRVVDANEPLTLRQYRLSKPEFVQIRTRDGFVMEAMLIRPANFDPAKKYPVYQHTYSGPHSQQVRNAWGGTTYLWHQFLAQHGVIVFVCDNRSASGKGAQSAWPVYKHLGEVELRDLEDGLQWLTAQPYVDASRTLITGWSYGGFMTAYALTHSTLWSAGIDGAGVTDWRDYDSIYTERYMLTPQNNEAGYRETAPRWAAKNLHGSLLILHGATDDNVHVQNTMQFAYELQKAGKLFRMMLYPNSRHGVTEPALAAQMRATMLAFVEETLLR
jgi:dipeptidyl-peptidase-4